MPVRRKKSKARASDVAAWAMFMQCGRDFFDELDAIGLDDTTAAPLAEAVWHEIGEAVIVYLDDLHRGFAPVERPIWAETEFGPPGGKRRRRAGS
jgi:hypothetical protein